MNPPPTSAALPAPFRAVGAWFKKPAAIWVIVGASLSIPLGFALYTGAAWEDFFITYRFSENLVRGHGLVYSPGEHVYGFTSPLNTLLPALFAWLTGADSFLVPLWLFRLVSLAGLGLGLAAITRLLLREHAGSGPAHLAVLLFPVIAVLEVKTTAFTMNGQETGLILAFLAPAFVLACTGWPARAALGGCLWAGLMYSRPDAFVYIAALMVAAAAFETGSRRALAAAFLKSALICALLYLPWLLLTWWYYGSPVPHTVTAKFAVEGTGDGAYVLAGPLAAGLQKAPAVLCWTLAPIYDWLTTGAGTWPRWTHDVELLLVLLAVLYWVLPTRDRLGRMASLFAFLLFGYLTYVAVVAQFAPWYYPPLAFMCLLVLMSAIATLVRRIPSPRMARGVAGLAVGGLAGFLLFLFVSSLRPLRFDQQIIEWDHRRVIGLWLKDHVQPGEAVYLEPLGYIGYFSQCKMLDWPGLVSPEVVAARRTLSLKAGYTWAETAEVLQPAWIVARADEVDGMRKSSILPQRYELVKVFDVTDRVRAVGNVPGMRMVYPEILYAVFHRREQ